MQPRCLQCGECCTRERLCRCCQPNPATVPSGSESDVALLQGQLSMSRRVAAAYRADADFLRTQLQEAVRLLERWVDWHESFMSETIDERIDTQAFLARHRAGSNKENKS